MVLARERLHAVLDARLPGAAWLHGPTGAGKTVLLRSYLRRAGRPSVWLTGDERFSDPAALFAALSALAEPVCSARLPAFSPEHRNDPDTFAQGFFQKLDQSMAPEQAVVFDDIHCIDTTTAALLGFAIDAFGGRRVLCFASQLRPDAAFARHLAGSQLWVVGHKLLAFDPDEARQLADQVGADIPAADALVEATDGWAAGLMLAMQLGAGSDASGDPLEPVRTPLAELIAGQVLGNVARDDLERLMLLAELPQVPMALGDCDPSWASACARLQGLADRGLFVERLAADRIRHPDKSAQQRSHDAKVAHLPKGCWRLHDLFRNALRDPSASSVLASPHGEDLTRHLLEVERLDLAWRLAARLGREPLARLVASHGAVALRDPQIVAMRQLAAIHATSESPSIAIWLARAWIGDDHPAALRACDAAYEGFSSTAQLRGKALSAALGMMIVASAIESVGALNEWATRLGEVERIDSASIADREEHALRVAGEVAHDLLIGNRFADDEEASSLQVSLLKDVVAELLSPDENIVVSSLLVVAMKRFNRLAEAELTIARTEGLPSYAQSAPHMRANWKIETGFLYRRVGQFELSRAAYAACLALADENALLHARVEALIGLVRLELGAGRPAHAAEPLQALDGIGALKLGKLHGWVVHLQARLNMTEGNVQRALTLLDAASRLLQDAGFAENAMTIVEHDRIQLFYGAGQLDAFRAQADRALRIGSAIDRAHARIAAGLLDAHAAFGAGSPEASALLREHLQAAETLNLFGFLQLLPRVAGELASRALDLGVQEEFVSRAIRLRGLPAPKDASRRWPWPYRVEVLGPFQLVCEGKPVPFTGKAQQKPLELLKFLATERELTSDFHAVTSALWPDAETPSARKNLEVTVSRLRKLLDDDSLVLVKQGKISLDITRVRSDAQEFSHVAAEAESVVARRPARDAVAHIADLLLQLFPSLPLDGEDATPWREGVRERYRNVFVRAVRSLVTYWREHSDPARSIALIESALSREPLAESLYQMLIQVYVGLGQGAEAMRVYRQCRQMLSVLIGAHPSAETERLRNTIQL